LSLALSIWNPNTTIFFSSVHYQKIDKYKRKYRGNIFVGKFPRYFTDENIPSVYTEGITMGKKIKTKEKKWWRVIFTDEITDGIYSVGNSVGKFVGKLWKLFIMSITKGIADGIFRRYFPESSRTVHFPIALLIVVLYRQNHQRIEKSLVLFGGFLKKIN